MIPRDLPALSLPCNHLDGVRFRVCVGEKLDRKDVKEGEVEAEVSSASFKTVLRLGRTRFDDN
jgi:hypothetical protein